MFSKININKPVVNVKFSENPINIIGKIKSIEHCQEDDDLCYVYNAYDTICKIFKSDDEDKELVIKLKDWIISTESIFEKDDIEKVIFNDPATIVYWSDGTKTVVKCQDDDKFDKEKGLAMAIVKKLFGNKGNYNKIFKKYIGENHE